MPEVRLSPSAIIREYLGPGLFEVFFMDVKILEETMILAVPFLA